jgi:hypothetical protein
METRATGPGGHRANYAAMALAIIMVACAPAGAAPSPAVAPGPTQVATASESVGVSATPLPATTPSPATASPATTPLPATTPSPVAVCPNPHGGFCLGQLAGGTYATRAFATTLTYTVPAGWANYEDLRGNFLLVPPTGSLEGGDAGTSDYVGVYDGVAVADAECAEQRQSGIEPTPAEMAAWFVGHEGLDTSEPAAVTVGGAAGVVLDLRLADGYSGGCPYEGYEDIPMVPLFIGAGPAEVHHVALGEIVTRLYLLEGRDGRTLAIEVSDVPGGTALEELDAIVHEFVFRTER